MNLTEKWDTEAEWYSVLDSLVTTHSTYCKKCSRSVSSNGESLERFTLKLLNEGWTSPARLEIICPDCTEKNKKQ